MWLLRVVICDMPKQEFSLRERVYIHNMYMKSRKSCSETQCKFRVKFPGGPVLNPSTIRRQAKKIQRNRLCKEQKSETSTSCSYRRNIRWDWQEIRTYPTKISKTFITGNWRLYKEQQNYWNYIYILLIYTRLHNENSCLGMSQIAIITITTLTALTYNNHNQ